MKQTAKALKKFFGGFGIPAYISDNLPDNVKMPYITYDLVEPEPLAYGYMNASVWYKSESALELIEKVDEIKAAIGEGVSLPTESGAVYLFREQNATFAQIRNDPNPETKRAYLSMIIHCNTL